MKIEIYKPNIYHAEIEYYIFFRCIIISAFNEIKNYKTNANMSTNNSSTIFRFEKVKYAPFSENKKTLYNDHKKRIDAFILSALEAPI